MSQPKKNTGFLALSSMVSDIESTTSTSNAKTVTPPHQKATTPSSSQTEAARAENTQAPAESGGSTTMWMAVLAAVVILLLFAIFGDFGTPGSGSGAGVARAIDASSTTPRAVTEAEVAASAPSAVTPSQSVAAESLPPVGTGLVLSESQIRYCLSESIRIEAWRSNLDASSDAALRPFNASVVDYNARCSNFRYRRRVFDRISAEVDANRSMLMQQARAHAASIGTSAASGQAEPAMQAAPAYVDAPSQPAFTQMPPLLALPASPQTFRTSFDCSKAGAAAERIVCTDAELAASDLALAGLFAQAQAVSADKAAFKQHAREQWNDRQLNCQDRECLVLWYARQNQWLSAVVSNQAASSASTHEPSAASQSDVALSAASSLSADERDSIETACSTDKYLHGPAAYNACVDSKLQDLARSPRHIDLSSLNANERSSIASACSTERYLRGPGAYNRCLTGKLAELNSAPRNIDLSSLTADERGSLESSCSTERYLRGPAAYDHCLADKVAELRNAPPSVDMSSLSVDEKSSIDSVCSTAMYLHGPAALNRCRSDQLAKLGNAPRDADLSKLDTARRSSVMSACSYEKYANGPTSYNRCIARHLKNVGGGDTSS